MNLWKHMKVYEGRVPEQMSVWLKEYWSIIKKLQFQILYALFLIQSLYSEDQLLNTVMVLALCWSLRNFSLVPVGFGSSPWFKVLIKRELDMNGKPRELIQWMEWISKKTPKPKKRQLFIDYIHKCNLFLGFDESGSRCLFKSHLSSGFACTQMAFFFLFILFLVTLFNRCCFPTIWSTYCGALLVWR